MKRYWFEFEIEKNKVFEYPVGINLGCGITAINYEDAIDILKTSFFSEIEMPKIIKVIENVNINELDQTHVIPNMNPPIYRGVWFPRM
jgi:hypothetical protein